MASPRIFLRQPGRNSSSTYDGEQPQPADNSHGGEKREVRRSAGSDETHDRQGGSAGQDVSSGTAAGQHHPTGRDGGRGDADAEDGRKWVLAIWRAATVRSPRDEDPRHHREPGNCEEAGGRDRGGNWSCGTRVHGFRVGSRRVVAIRLPTQIDRVSAVRPGMSERHPRRATSSAQCGKRVHVLGNITPCRRRLAPTSQRHLAPNSGSGRDYACSRRGNPAAVSAVYSRR